MKKHYYYILIIVISFFYFPVASQTINQAANWPNGNWVITGTYNSNATAFESNPTTTPNFAFNDRGSDYGQRDNIAAESPVIDLTDAYNNGETLLSLEVQYVYKHYSYIPQSLVIEYWNDDMQFWLPWKVVNGNTNQDNSYCYLEKTALLMRGLDISGFSSGNLSHFKYRISYTDPSDGSFGWGFCFDAPTLKSNTPISTPNCAINPTPVDNATDVPLSSLNYTWNPAASGESPTFYKVYFGVINSSNLQYKGDFSDTSFHILVASYNRDYYIKVVPVNLAGEATSCPIWHFTSEGEPPVPDNDVCSGAYNITLAPQDLGCTTPTLMNNHSANNSSSLLGIPTVSCTSQDANSGDLWYTFTASTSCIKVMNLNTGSTWFMLGYAIYDDCSASNEIICNSLNDGTSAIHCGLTPGTTYFIRLFDSSNQPPWDGIKEFCLEEYTPTTNPPANDECINAINLDVQNVSSFIVSNTTTGTIAGATDSGIPGYSCVEGSNPTPNDDVWYKFTASIENLNITINDNSQTDCTVELFSGDCNNLTQIQCASGGENPTISISDLTVNEEYFVRVFSDDTVIPTEPVFEIAVWGDNGLNNANYLTSNTLIYPNPVKDNLIINSTKMIDSIIIYNSLGQIVKSIIPNKTKLILDLKGMKSGIYFAKIKIANQTQTFHFVKY